MRSHDNGLRFFLSRPIPETTLPRAEIQYALAHPQQEAQMLLTMKAVDNTKLFILKLTSNDTATMGSTRMPFTMADRFAPSQFTGPSPPPAILAFAVESVIVRHELPNGSYYKRANINISIADILIGNGIPMSRVAGLAIRPNAFVIVLVR
jgi:hypothetical protein